jgi:signal transduction histidine kinase
LQDKCVCLHLADDGAGIAPGDALRIFEPFFTTKRAEGGSGLGLAIVRSLLDSANGDIALVPSERGATLALSLPIAPR